MTRVPFNPSVSLKELMNSYSQAHAKTLIWLGETVLVTHGKRAYIGILVGTKIDQPSVGVVAVFKDDTFTTMKLIRKSYTNISRVGREVFTEDERDRLRWFGLHGTPPKNINTIDPVKNYEGKEIPINSKVAFTTKDNYGCGVWTGTLIGSRTHMTGWRYQTPKTKAVIMDDSGKIRILKRNLMKQI